MKRFNSGEVWLYSPTGDYNLSLDKSKNALYGLDIMSFRPVVIYRGLDPMSPYGDIVVLPCTRKDVPVIEFPVDDVNVRFLQNCKTIRVKPYEPRTINVDRLIDSKYFGRLTEDEFDKLDAAYEAYMHGKSIEEVCDPQSVEVWKKHKLEHIDPNTVRQSIALNGANNLLDDDAFSVLVDSYFKHDTTPKKLEPVEYHTPAQPPVSPHLVAPPVKPATPVTPAPVQRHTRPAHSGATFEIPSNMKDLHRVCKTYCGSKHVSVAVVAAINTVPLADADAILSMQNSDIQKKYDIPIRAAGAVKLLAQDYITNGHRFSFKSYPTEPDMNDCVNGTVHIEPTPVAEPAVAKSISVVSAPVKPKVVEVSEPEESDAANKIIKEVQYYLTDRTIRYVNDATLRKILSIPKETVQAAYAGKNFTMNYSNLCKRAGVTLGDQAMAAK